MSNFDWQKFLKDWSRAILKLPEVAEFHLPKEAIDSEWLGFDGASEEQIQQTEIRLGMTLPPFVSGFPAGE